MFSHLTPQRRRIWIWMALGVLALLILAALSLNLHTSVKFHNHVYYVASHTKRAKRVGKVILY